MSGRCSTEEERRRGKFWGWFGICMVPTAMRRGGGKKKLTFGDPEIFIGYQILSQVRSGG